MAPTKRSIGPQVTDAQKALLAAFGNTNHGAETVIDAYCNIQEFIGRTNLDVTPELLIYAWESWPHIYRGVLARELKGMFTRGELALMVDIVNSLMLTPMMAGQHLLADIEDGIALEGLDRKWKVDGAMLLKKIRGLSLAQVAVLEVWLKSFWASDSTGVGALKEPGAIERWIEQLL